MLKRLFHKRDERLVRIDYHVNEPHRLDLFSMIDLLRRSRRLHPPSIG